MPKKWCLINPKSKRIVEIFSNEEHALIYRAHKPGAGLKIKPFTNALKNGYQLPSSTGEEPEPGGLTDFLGEFAEKLQSTPVDELPPPSEERGLLAGASRVGSRMTGLNLTDLLCRATIQDDVKDWEVHDSLWKMERSLREILRS